MLLLAGLAVAISFSSWATACDSGSGEPSGGAVTTSGASQGPQSGDIKGRVGETVEVGDAVVNVRALHATFQPAMPGQRLSEQTPSAPAAGESFFQARVRVENRGASAIRVDPRDFACAVGDSVVLVEPTRSGPPARSLLENTSLDLLLTFKGQAGFEPVLIYSPPWYSGTIRISPQSEETTGTS
ncbi:MAG: hypothetical protein ABH877_00215 [bacterium]